MQRYHPHCGAFLQRIPGSDLSVSGMCKIGYPYLRGILIVDRTNPFDSFSFRSRSLGHLQIQLIKSLSKERRSRVSSTYQRKTHFVQLFENVDLDLCFTLGGEWLFDRRRRKLIGKELVHAHDHEPGTYRGQRLIGPPFTMTNLGRGIGIGRMESRRLRCARGITGR